MMLSWRVIRDWLRTRARALRGNNVEYARREEEDLESKRNF